MQRRTLYYESQSIWKKHPKCLLEDRHKSNEHKLE